MNTLGQGLGVFWLVDLGVWCSVLCFVLFFSSLAADDNQRPSSGTLLTHQSPSWGTQPGHSHFLLATLSVQCLLKTPKSPFLLSVVPRSAGWAAGPLHSLLVWAHCNLAEEELCAGREQCLWWERSSPQILPLALSSKNNCLEAESKKTHSFSNVAFTSVNVTQ